jgi:UPF0755 protein
MHSMDELGTEAGLTRAERTARRRRMLRRRRRTVTIIVAALVLLLGGGAVAVTVTGGAISDVLGRDTDYEGEGKEDVVVEVAPGSSLTQIANQLVEEDVIRSSRPFIKEAERREASFQARSYALRTQMSAAAAVEAMLNPDTLPQVQVPEGMQLKDISARMVESGMDQEAVDAALEDRTPADYGLEVEAPSLEGYLFPATYDVRPGSTAEDVVQEMVDRTAAEIEELGLAEDEANEILTLASLVEVEAPGDPEVRRKVARVLLNRIGPDSATDGLIQSDATVAYIHGAREDLTTTEEERGSDSPYNTYRHKGLPPGPINSPGRDTVEAVQDPAEGDWQYFVAVDPDTGETKFATSYEDHLKNVEEYREWLRSHGESTDAADSAAETGGADG